jgi:hypothetical protein
LTNVPVFPTQTVFKQKMDKFILPTTIIEAVKRKFFLPFLPNKMPQQEKSFQQNPAWNKLSVKQPDIGNKNYLQILNNL